MSGVARWWRASPAPILPEIPDQHYFADLQAIPFFDFFDENLGHVPSFLKLSHPLARRIDTRNGANENMRGAFFHFRFWRGHFYGKGAVSKKTEAGDGNKCLSVNFHVQFDTGNGKWFANILYRPLQSPVWIWRDTPTFARTILAGATQPCRVGARHDPAQRWNSFSNAKAGTRGRDPVASETSLCSRRFPLATNATPDQPFPLIAGKVSPLLAKRFAAPAQCDACAQSCCRVTPIAARRGDPHDRPRIRGDVVLLGSVGERTWLEIAICKTAVSHGKSRRYRFGVSQLDHSQNASHFLQPCHKHDRVRFACNRSLLDGATTWNHFCGGWRARRRDGWSEPDENWR